MILTPQKCLLFMKIMTIFDIFSMVMGNRDSDSVKVVFKATTGFRTVHQRLVRVSYFINVALNLTVYCLVKVKNITALSTKVLLENVEILTFFNLTIF